MLRKQRIVGRRKKNRWIGNKREIRETKKAEEEGGGAERGRHLMSLSHMADAFDLHAPVHSMVATTNLTRGS